MNFHMEFDALDPSAQSHRVVLDLDVRTLILSASVDGGPVVHEPLPARQERELKSLLGGHHGEDQESEVV
jgi:hypothetical protein